METFFDDNKNTYLNLASILARKDNVFDEIKQGISSILLKNVTLAYIQENLK